MISKGYLQCEAEVMDPLKRDCKQNLYISDKKFLLQLKCRQTDFSMELSL